MPEALTLKYDGSTLSVCAEERWSLSDARKIYNLPFNDLLFQAHSVHREGFDPNAVQLSRLLSIKTGGARRIVGIAANPRTIPPALKLPN